MGIIPTKVTTKSLKVGEEVEPESLRPQPIRDILLVCGDATGVFDDIWDFLDFKVMADIMLINYLPTVWPESFEYQHYVAGDSHMPDMQSVVKKHVPERTIKHCWNPSSKGFDIRWIRKNKSGWSGTTANLALQVALALDYTRIVLAGVPMDASGNWYTASIPENDIKQNKDHTAHLWKWTEIACRPVARFLRSMSGNTRDLFGEPDLNWLINFNGRRTANG